METPKVSIITNKCKKYQQETLREICKANKDVTEGMKEYLHIKNNVAECKPELGNEVGAAMKSRMGGVAGPHTGGGGGGRGARYGHLYQQEKFSITTDIQDMLGSHHRLDMGSSWREKRSLEAKIQKELETEKESKGVLEDKNILATTHIRNCSQQEAGKRSDMTNNQETTCKDDDTFKKID